MELEWRPLTAAEVLERTFHIYRAHLRVFVALAVPAALGCTAWAAWLQFGERAWPPGFSVSAAAAVWQGGCSLLGVYVALLAYALPLAAITSATAALLRGKQIGMAASYRQVWPRTFCYLRLSAAAALAMTWPLLAVLVVFAAWQIWAAPDAAAGPWLLLIYLVALPACIWLLCRYALCMTICVVEQVGILASIRRSVSLSVGLRLKIFLLVLLVYVLSLICRFAASVPVFEAFPHLPGHLPLAAGVYELVTGFVLTLVSVPVYSIGLMMIYVDARIRKEGSAWP
uniref:Glycerophosphoryl diester phosphodiesterase membrane domain-containing protein n=1 Tax=Acidobacterium capsulatum TaxID=33075 RepID=A0A7V5CSV7_9BACT